MHDTYDEQHWNLATADGMREPDIEDATTSPTVAGVAAAEPAVH